MKSSQLLGVVGVGLLGLAIALEALVGVALGYLALALLTGVGSGCVAVSLWRARPAEEKRFISLGAVFCLYYAMSYGFAVLGASPPFAQRLLPNGLEAVDLTALPVGILAWLIGYRLLDVPPLTSAARRIILPKTSITPVSPSTLLALFFTTVIVRLWLIFSGAGYGYLRDVVDATTSASSLIQYLVLYGDFGTVILGLAIVASGHAPSHRAGYRRTYLWILPFEVLLSLLAGNKSGVLLLLVMVVACLAAAGKLTVSPRRVALFGLVGVLVVFPLIGTYRDILRPESGRQLSSAQAPAAAVTALNETASTVAAGPVAYGRFAFDQTAGRLREIDRAAVAIRAHDSGKPYTSPTEMAERVATGLVPRPLWPDKPLNLYALEVSRGYYGLSTRVISASSLSPLGDAYRHGGLPMVAVSLAILGAFVRFLDDMLAPKHSIWLVPLLVAAIPLVRGGDLAGLLVAAIRYFLVIGVLYRFLFIRSMQSLTIASPHRAGGSRSHGW